MALQAPNDKKPDSSGQVMLFAIGSSIIVGLVMLGLIVVGVLPRLAAPAAQPDDPSGPYLTLRRPVPSSTNLYDIFAVTVADFTGTQWLGSVQSGFTITYTRGAETLTIVGRQAVTLPAARFLVEDVRNRRGPANRAERILPGQFANSYYLDERPGDVRFAWSRDSWFFDVQAPSIEALNVFMAAFPY
jgi:hypothetical protein